MDYLFTKQDTVLFFCVLIYIGLTLFQFVKTIISTQVDKSTSPVRGLWFVARVVLILPLLWTVRYFI